MRRDWIRDGLATGILASSATAGALVRVGLRDGRPAAPFNALASILLGPSLSAVAHVGGVTLVGVTVHVAVMLAVAIAYAWIVTRSGGYRWRWALVAAAAWLSVSFLLVPASGNASRAPLQLADRVTVGVVLAVTLAVGMRLAFPVPRRD